MPGSGRCDPGYTRRPRRTWTAVPAPGKGHRVRRARYIPRTNPQQRPTQKIGSFSLPNGASPRQGGAVAKPQAPIQDTASGHRWGPRQARGGSENASGVPHGRTAFGMGPWGFPLDISVPTSLICQIKNRFHPILAQLKAPTSPCTHRLGTPRPETCSFGARLLDRPSFPSSIPLKRYPPLPLCLPIFGPIWGTR